MLKISSYWYRGDWLEINLLPNHDLLQLLDKGSSQTLKNLLSDYLPKRLLPLILDENLLDKPIKQLLHADLSTIHTSLTAWRIKPNNTEGYRTAEVTLGGVDCNELSSKTFASLKHPNLYFIGEVIDVSGWLGGYNFQWAWASGWAAGQYV